MGPIGHTVVSSSVGFGVLAGTGSIEAAATTLAVGVLMDVDHLYDYYQRFARGKHGRIYVLFHGWEYSLVGLVIMSFFFHSPMFIGEGLRKMQSHTHPALQLFARAMISPHDK